MDGEGEEEEEEEEGRVGESLLITDSSLSLTSPSDLFVPSLSLSAFFCIFLRDGGGNGGRGGGEG